MALIICPECGKEVTDTSKKCMYCGYKFRKKTSKVMIITISICAAVLIIGGIVAGIVVNNQVIQPQKKYKAAEEYLARGNYDSAIDLFSELDGYKDSDKRIVEVRYMNALELMDDKDFDEAIEIFEELGRYEDSKDKILECYYEKGKLLYKKSKYDEAKEAFEEAEGYGDSDRYIDKIDDAGKEQAAVSRLDELKSELKSAYELEKSNSQVSLASDGLSITIDGKNDRDYDSYNSVMNILSELGLPDSLSDSMDHTTALMGKQSETYGDWTVSWSYHPDNGLDVIIQINE